MRQKAAGIFLCFLLLASANQKVFAAKDSLGLSANVLQSQDSASAIGANSSLWYLLKPGTSTVRQISVRSLANVPMVVSSKIGYGVYLNGIAEFDESKKTPASKWITFSEPTFTLGVGATRIISLTMNIPKETQIGTNLATLFINGAALRPVRQSSGYAVAGQARVAIPMFIGVGTIAEIATSFTIDGTRIYNEQGARFAAIKITNNGKTPIAPSGSIEIQNVSGDIKFDKPVVLYSKTLIPRESGLITVRIPTAIPNGKWLFKESLAQGAFAQSKEVKVALTTPSIFTRTNGIRFGLFLLSVLILIIGLTRRRKTSPTPKQESIEVESLFDFDVLLAEINAELARPISSKFGRNESTKKVTKKAVKKNAKKAIKKTPLKKPALVKKIAPTKKKTTKKVAKKVAKKVSPRR